MTYRSASTAEPRSASNTHLDLISTIPSSSQFLCDPGSYVPSSSSRTASRRSGDYEDSSRGSCATTCRAFLPRFLDYFTELLTVSMLRARSDILPVLRFAGSESQNGSNTLCVERLVGLQSFPCPTSGIYTRTRPPS